MLAITFANAGTTRVQLSDMDVSLTYPRRKMRSPLMKLSGRGPGCARGKGHESFTRGPLAPEVG
jgi:hypothetical protein